MSQMCTALNMKPGLHDNHQHSSIQKTMEISDMCHSLQDIPGMGNCEIEVGSKVYKELTSMIKGNRQSPPLSVEPPSSEEFPPLSLPSSEFLSRVILSQTSISPSSSQLP